MERGRENTAALLGGETLNDHKTGRQIAKNMISAASEGYNMFAVAVVVAAVVVAAAVVAL
jgi:hypothetical protein